jgi:L-threonylcarbamoyladenylate synthase
VPALAAPLSALRNVRRAVMQSSANASGEPDARRLADVPAALREAVDLALDGGKLPGTPSTVLDLRGFEPDGAWSVLRPGAVDAAALAAALDGV